MKKVTMILRHHFFVRWILYTGLSHWGGRHSSGGRLCRSPQECDTYVLVYYLLKILWKNQGLK